MIDFANFLRLLRRYRLTLVIVPLVAVIITFFLVRNVPDVYIARTQMATGITDQSQQVLKVEILQGSQVEEEFSNLIQMLRMRKVINQVSYQLIIHDLTHDTAFRKPSGDFKNMSPDARKHAAAVFLDMYNKHQMLSTVDKDQENLHDLMESMRYDAQSLEEKLRIYRQGNSDFITLEFESENPDLSAYVINTLANEFTSYYTFIIKQNQRQNIDFLAKLLQEKMAALNGRMDELKNYKVSNRILNLNEQAKSLYGQLADFETRREEAERQIVSNQQALASIDLKFDPRDRKYVESTLTKVNRDIMGTREQLRIANSNYVSSGFDKQYQVQIDSLQDIITEQINISTDKYVYSPLVAKQDLIVQKLNLMMALDLNKGSVSSIDHELVRLNHKLDGLVPHEGEIQEYESDIQVKSQEYIEILKKYNQTMMESDLAVKLHQVEVATPPSPEPSKKMVLVILSGIIGLVFCIVILFVLFYFDTAIRTPKDLADKSHLPVLGYLPTLSADMFDLKKIWSNGGAPSTSVQQFKDLMRSIRFEIDRDMQGGKKIQVSSMSHKEGKTLFAVNLAYAYAMVNKKVLLIDGNFVNPSISQSTKPELMLEDYLKNRYYTRQFSRPRNHYGQ